MVYDNTDILFPCAILFSDLAIEAMATGPEQKDHAQFKFNIGASILTNHRSYIP